MSERRRELSIVVWILIYNLFSSIEEDIILRLQFNLKYNGILNLVQSGLLYLIAIDRRTVSKRIKVISFAGIHIACKLISQSYDLITSTQQFIIRKTHFLIRTFKCNPQTNDFQSKQTEPYKLLKYRLKFT